MVYSFYSWFFIVGFVAGNDQLLWSIAFIVGFVAGNDHLLWSMLSRGPVVQYSVYR